MWPASLRGLLELFKVLGLDLLAQARLPCLFEALDYYSLLTAVMVVPPLAVAAIFAAAMAWARCRRRKRRALRAIQKVMTVHTREVAERLREWERRRGSDKNVCVDGLWLAAPWVLNFLDLVFPVVTRTCFQFFVCRDLRTGTDGTPHGTPMQ